MKTWLAFSKIIVCAIMFTSCNEIASEEINNEPISRNSIGLYGGSIAYSADTSFWQNELGIKIYTHAVGGAGFTAHTNVPIPEQIEQSPLHDIVILWCSTNDFSSPVENTDKYSPYTQNGGMRISIKKLRAKNPDAVILGFCSLPCFDGRDGTAYVEGQITVFQEYGIPYLNQFNFFTAADTGTMYYPDKLHLTESGYLHIRDRQLAFIRIHTHGSDSRF